MFRNAELEQLRVRKELLVLQSDTGRLLLAAQWQQLRAPEYWLGQAGNAAFRHPIWATALGAGAGVLAIKLLGRPLAKVGRLGRWGGAASTAFSLWRLLRRTRQRR